MPQQPNAPDLLYKYRAFSDLTLNMLVADQIFFADPSTFNDPLDTRPSLEIDLELEELKSILRILTEERVSAEMSAAAKTIKYKGPKTVNHISDHSRKSADKIIAEISYSATDPVYDFEDDGKFLFGIQIEQELLRRYEKGIFSLAERPNCPLMWSHYAQQHKGICIGYSTPERAKKNLHKIRYGESRLIQASTVKAMLNGDELSRQKVDEAVISCKAEDWGYEREWRLVGTRGLANSPLELEEVIFGMRCDWAVQFAVVKALAGRQRNIRFFEIRETRGSFELVKSELDVDELLVHGPLRSLDVYDAFENLEDIEGNRSSGSQ